MADTDDIDIDKNVDEIIEEIEEEEEEEDDDSSKKTVKKIVKRSSSHGFLTNLSKEDVILGVLLVATGIFIGYIVFRTLNRNNSSRYFPHMPVFRPKDEFPSAPPIEQAFNEVPRHERGRHGSGRKTRHGYNVDIETGDLLLGEPGHEEHWVVKRNMFGDIIDCYKIYSDDELK